MKLEQALHDIAEQCGIEADKLLDYAAQDTIGGYDTNERLSRWPGGNIWAVEGKILYALAWALDAKVIGDMSKGAGCSTEHLKGGAGGREVSVGGIEWLAGQEDESLDLLFADTDNTSETVAIVARLAKDKLRPGGVLIVHNAAKDFSWMGGGGSIASDVGKRVRAGLDMAAVPYRVYGIDPSDCGLAIYVRGKRPVVVGTDDLWGSGVVDPPAPVVDKKATKPRQPRKPRTGKKVAKSGS